MPLAQPQQQIDPPGKEPWSDNASTPRLLLTFDAGLNENVSPTPSECTQGYNFDLAFNRPSLIPRAPFDLKGTAPNAGAITGFMQLVKRDSTQTTLVAAGGTVYQWDGLTTFTSKGSITSPGKLRGCYWSLGDYLVISDVNKNNVVSKWDGTTFGPLTTGLASNLYAKYAFVFNSRVWLFNITYGTTSYPHMILVSKFEDPTNWDISTRGGASTVGGGTFATGLEAFYVLTPNERPINGVEVFQNVLLISTLNDGVYQLSGTSAKDYQFVPFNSSFPAVGDEALKNIGSDIVNVVQGGHIPLLYATQSYGSMLGADLSAWLPTTTANMNTINSIVYDIERQRVLFFIPGKVLVLFKELLAQDRVAVNWKPSPWSIYTTNDTSQFNTSHAIYMLQPGSSNYSVFFGDSTGRIFDLNGQGAKDAGSSPVTVLRRSRHFGTEILNPWPWTDENITGHVRYRRVSQASLAITFDWDDEYSTITSNVTLKGPVGADAGAYFGGSYYYNGSSYYNQGFNAIGRVSSMNIEPGGKGPGFYITVSSDTSLPIQVDAIEVD